MNDQLIERVAQAIYEGYRNAGRGIAQPFGLMDQWQREMWLQAARAGAALVAEECAKIAADHAHDAVDAPFKAHEDNHPDGYADASNDIDAAIRDEFKAPITQAEKQ